MKTRLILLTIMITVGTFVACESVTLPDPPTEDLLLPIEQLPSTWEVSGSPRSMGPHIGFGDEDDAYVNFKLKGSKYNISSHFVLYYPSMPKAEAEFLAMSRSNFNDNSIAVDEPWETPIELSYVSSHADQFRVACTINNVAGQKRVCKMMGQYGQYVTIFHSVIRSDTMSLRQFNDVIQFLDKMMMEKLQLDRSG